MKSWTWTNAKGSGTWGDAKNWSPEGAPENGDEVTLPAVDAQGNTGVNGPSGAPALSLSKLTLQGLTLYDGPFTVTGMLEWNAGSVDADIEVTGAANVTGLDGSPSNPELLNQHTMTVTGTASITGPAGSSTAQLRIDTGSRFVNTGTVSLTSAGFASLAGFGVVVNNGSVRVSGSCRSSGVITMTHNRGAQISIAAGAEFVVGTDVLLRLAGGTVVGDGTLRVGDGGGGTIDTVVDTTVAQLTIGGSGSVAPGLGAGMPSRDRPGALTVQKSLHWGAGGTSRQVAVLLGHLVLAPGAVALVENDTYIDDGKFENAGHVTLAKNAVMLMEGPRPVFVNNGTVTMTGLSTINGGSLTNAGLVEKVGAGTATLNTGLVNRGNLTINEGVLQVGDADWTVPAGTITLRGGGIQGQALGAVMLVGGPEGGVLAGAGTVDATVVNAGWIEPAPPGMAVREYRQEPEGNILLPPAALTAAPPLLTLGGVNLQLDGSLWLAG